MSSKSFNGDKKFGDIIEEEILNIIQKKHPKAKRSADKGKFSDYDIIIPELNKTVEVKGDYRSNETNNLVIEVEMFNKPSALSVTKSDYWIFVDGYKLVWVKPINIYRFLEQSNYSRREITGRGDSFSKMVYLVNKKEFFDYIERSDGSMINTIIKTSPIYFDNIYK